MFPQVDACAKGLFVGMVSQSDKYSAHLQQRFENFSKSVQFFDEVMVVVNIHREGILRGFISFPPVDTSKLEFGQNPLMGMFVDPMRE